MKHTSYQSKARRRRVAEAENSPVAGLMRDRTLSLGDAVIYSGFSATKNKPSLCSMGDELKSTSHSLSVFPGLPGLRLSSSLFGLQIWSRTVGRILR